jgi:hypothetical protein
MQGTPNDNSSVTPAEADPERPSIARIYDFFLDGNAWFPIDEVVGEQIRQKVPEAYDIAQNNRTFVRRSTRWLARRGVSQFIDIGSGLPTQQNTHEVAQQINPEARIVYCDHDPMVASHAAELLGKASNVVYLPADVRKPSSVLDAPETRELIDFRRPVGLVLTGVLHCVDDEEDPYGLIAQYLAAVPSGSYLVLTHFTSDEQDPGAVERWIQMTANANEQLVFRSRAEVERFFEGLALMAPGEATVPELMWANRWLAPDPEAADISGSWLWAGVGRKP